MKKIVNFLVSLSGKTTKTLLVTTAFASLAFAGTPLDKNKNYSKLKEFKPNPKVTSQQCLSCHKAQDPGIAKDWAHSKHAQNGVGCVDCHVVPKDYPNAFKAHPFKGANWTVQAAVSSVTCAKCHSKEVEEFLNKCKNAEYKIIDIK